MALRRLRSNPRLSLGFRDRAVADPFRFGFCIIDFFSPHEPRFFSMVDEETRKWQNGLNANFDTQYVKMQHQNHTSSIERVVNWQCNYLSRPSVLLHTHCITLAFSSQTAHFAILGATSPRQALPPTQIVCHPAATNCTNVYTPQARTHLPLGGIPCDLPAMDVQLKSRLVNTIRTQDRRT